MSPDTRQTSSARKQDQASHVQLTRSYCLESPMVANRASDHQSPITRAVSLCSSCGVWLVTAGFALLGMAADLAV
jgi:hypothetical protein